MAVLLILMFSSKFFYTTSLHSYLTFYLIDKFAIPVRVRRSSTCLSSCSARRSAPSSADPSATASPARQVIWWSILGVAPVYFGFPLHASLS